MLIKNGELAMKGLNRSTFEVALVKNLHTSLIGGYQPRNIALVCEAVDALCKVGVQISEDALYEGISTAKWPARFELLSSEPPVVFDGGHNEEGVRAAIETAKHVFGEKVISLTGVMADKAYAPMAVTGAPSMAAGTSSVAASVVQPMMMAEPSAWMR